MLLVTCYWPSLDMTLKNFQKLAHHICTSGSSSRSFLGRWCHHLSALKRSDWWRDANSVSWWAAVKGLTLMCWLDCDNEPITGMIWIWGDDFIFNFSVVIVGPFFWHHHSNLRCRWEFNGCTLTRTNQFSRKTTPPFWCVRIIRRIQFLWLTAEHQWEVLMLYSCGLQF